MISQLTFFWEVMFLRTLKWFPKNFNSSKGFEDDLTWANGTMVH